MQHSTNSQHPSKRWTSLPIDDIKDTTEMAAIPATNKKKVSTSTADELQSTDLADQIFDFNRTGRRIFNTTMEGLFDTDVSTIPQTKPKQISRPSTSFHANRDVPSFYANADMIHATNIQNDFPPLNQHSSNELASQHTSNTSNQLASTNFDILPAKRVCLPNQDYEDYFARTITRDGKPCTLVTWHLEDLLNHFKIQTVPAVPSIETLTTIMRKQHQNHRHSTIISTILQQNLNALKKLAPAFEVSYLLASFEAIFDCYWLQLNDRLKIAMDMFNIDEQKLLEYLMSFNIRNINNFIDQFLIDTNNSENIKLGVSGNVENRMRTHRCNFCVSRYIIPIRNLAVEEASFIELCGIIYLKRSANTQALNVLNESSGYDSWSILDNVQNADSNAIYLFSALDGVKKKKKSFGKLHTFNRSNKEDKKPNMWYNLATFRNSSIDFKDINYDMKTLHRKNVECDVHNCDLTFSSELAMKVHKFETHILNECSCTVCNFVGNMNSVQNHCNQSRDCVPKQKHRKITKPKSRDDRLYNMNVGLNRISEVIQLSSRTQQWLAIYTETKKEFFSEYETNKSKNVRIFTIENQSEIIEKHQNGETLPTSDKNYKCNVLAHKGDMENKEFILWYYPSPWVLFKLLPLDQTPFPLNGDQPTFDQTTFTVTGDFVGTAHINLQDFVYLSAKTINGDITKYQKIPLMKHNKNLFKLHPQELSGLSNICHHKLRYPHYIENLNEFENK